MTAETARLQDQVREGVLSQENCGKNLREMSETLAGIQNGTLMAYLLEDGGVFTSTASPENAHYQITGDGVTSIMGAE